MHLQFLAVSVNGATAIHAKIGLLLRFLAVVGLIGIASCGRIGFGQPEREIDPMDLVVEPLFPTNGVNWNDWVGYDRSLAFFQQEDASCTAEHRGYQRCLHAGALRQVKLPAVSTCDSVAATDSLGYFRWECVLIEGQAVVVSVALHDEIRVADLVNVPSLSFRPNRVEVSIGSEILQTEPAQWWSNPIQALPTEGGALPPVEGTIWVAAADAVVSALHITSDRQVITMPMGVAVQWNGAGDATCRDSERCLLQSVGFDYSWIEGHFHGDGVAEVVVHVADARRVTLRNLRVSHSGSILDAAALTLDRVRDSRVRRLEVHRTGRSGVYLRDSSENLLDGLSLGNSDGAYAITLSARNNVFHNIRVFNFSQNVVWERRSPTLSQLNTYASIVGGSANRVTLSGSHWNIHHVTRANMTSGYRLRGGDSSASNLVALNTSMTGFLIETQRSQFAHLVSVQSGEYGFDFTSGARDNVFSGLVQVGDNVLADCEGSEASQGLMAPTCANQGSSTATVQAVTALESAFVGPVADDSDNEADDLGPPSADTIDGDSTFMFAHSHRGWGQESATFDSSARSRCSGTTLCRVWDLGLREADARLRAVYGTARNGEPCPDSVTGSRDGSGRILQDVYLAEMGGDGICDEDDTCSPAPNVFLAHAIEVLHDFRGDDDTLCETGEACIFAPNLGAYQGDGDWRSNTCAFQDGDDISDVTMHFYPLNGR